MNKFDLPVEAIANNLPAPTMRHDRESVVYVTGAENFAAILTFNDLRELMEKFSDHDAVQKSFETEGIAWRVLANRALHYYKADPTGQLTELTRVEWAQLVMPQGEFLTIGADNDGNHRFYLRLDPVTLTYLLKLRETTIEVMKLGKPFGINMVECDRTYSGLGLEVWDGTHSFGNVAPSNHGDDEFVEPSIRKLKAPVYLLREDIPSPDEYGLNLRSLFASVRIESVEDSLRFFVGGRGSEAIYSVPVRYDLLKYYLQSSGSTAAGA